jgi:hypothetical protein
MTYIITASLFIMSVGILLIGIGIIKESHKK